MKKAALWVWAKIQIEPSAFFTLIRLGLIMLTTYGLNLTKDQQAATLAFFVVLFHFLTRPLVTPTITAVANVAQAANTVAVSNDPVSAAQPYLDPVANKVKL